MRESLPDTKLANQCHLVKQKYFTAKPQPPLTVVDERHYGQISKISFEAVGNVYIGDMRGTASFSATPF